MSGHSKWANIKRQKAVVDKKRAKIFTKLLKEIAVATKSGLPDPDSNSRLRLAVQRAKQKNMPKDTIERAIKKAAGEGADSISEINYEGFGPNGVGVWVECQTDNPTRTIANIRSYFGKNGGNIGTNGCLQFVFERKCVFEIAKGNIDEDDFTMSMIDAGAEDVEFEDGMITVTGPMESFGPLQAKFQELNIETESGGLERVPTTFKKIDKETYDTVMKLIDALEDDDDVQQVYHNIEFDESLLK